MLKTTAWVFLVVLFLSCSRGEGPGEEIVPPRYPFIDSLSAGVVVPGDTLAIYGGNFSPTASLNSVGFNNVLAVAVPFFSTAHELQVIVPENATSGPLWVEVGGLKSDGFPVEVYRGIGEVWIVGASSLPYSFKVRAGGLGDTYLLIPYFAVEAAGWYSFTVLPDTTSVFPLRRSRGDRSLPASRFGFNREDGSSLRKRGRWPIGHGPGVQHEATTRFRERVARLLGPYRQPEPYRPGLGSAQAPDSESFFVVSDLTGNPANPLNYTNVTADLVYRGTNCLIYADRASPPGGYTQTDYDYFGSLFDQTIYPNNKTYFGPPTDIDNNDGVVILFTPVINTLSDPQKVPTEGFIAGMFHLSDLITDTTLAPNGTSNRMEIFYGVVPDTGGQYGFPFTKTRVMEIIPGILAHEFEHMISFGHRLTRYGLNYAQDRWLEEGMAHIAEDLNGMNADNRGRAARYLNDTAAVALEGEDTLEQRGAIYLFLRYIGDRLGEGIFKAMVQSSYVGSMTVERVTGEPFFITVGKWLAALYFSGPGRGVPVDSLYTYTTDLGTTFDSLAVEARSVGQGPFGGAIGTGSGRFYTLDGAMPPALNLTVSFAEGKPLRLVVARIR